MEVPGIPHDDHGLPDGPRDALNSATASLQGAVSQLHRADLETATDDDLLDLLTILEVEARRLHAARLRVLGSIDKRGLHLIDGHASAKVLVRHRCRLSGPEAARRARAQRALDHLTLIAEAFEAGSIGADQVDLIAAVHTNPRVRDALVGFQSELLVLASECDYSTFETAVRQWERLADADGPEPRADRAHGRRFTKLTQNRRDMSWTLTGSFGPLQGARINDILRHFSNQEWADDWATAKATHGDNTLPADLDRTHAQHNADALERICEQAAAAPDNAKGPATEHLIVWDADTYLATVHRTTCRDPHCTVEAHITNRWYNPDTYRCHTVDGHPLEPVEAALDSLHHHIRTILITNGTPTHIGSRQRLFRGRNRLAVQLQNPTCVWPGCWVTVTDCEADHIQPHTGGGATSPVNGAPLCGRHNRWKQKGFTTGRDPDTRRWRTERPDGTDIT